MNVKNPKPEQIAGHEEFSFIPFHHSGNSGGFLYLTKDASYIGNIHCLPHGYGHYHIAYAEEKYRAVHHEKIKGILGTFKALNKLKPEILKRKNKKR